MYSRVAIKTPVVLDSELASAQSVVSADGITVVLTENEKGKSQVVTVQDKTDCVTLEDAESHGKGEILVLDDIDDVNKLDT